MALNKITYDNKQTLVDLPSVAEVNKCTASNLNEIKSVVNNAIDQVDTNTNNLTPTTYSLTNTPAHSAGTNVIKIYKVGNIVIMNCNLWCESLTQNSWNNIAIVPNDIRPSYSTNGMATLVSGSNGNYIGLGLIEVYEGNLRIKPNIAVSSSLTGIRFNISYVL